MSQISYGSITIVDVTDIGQFSVYPRANASKTQIYNPDANSYMPNWDNSAGGTEVTISPVAYYAGRNITSSATFTWQRRNGGGAASALIQGEAVSGQNLVINKNVLANATGGLITYVCTAHYTVDGIALQAIGQIDFSLVRQGSSAKIAKITGDNIFKINSSGSFVNTSIVLTATVDNTAIAGWKYYDPTNSNKDTEGYVIYPQSGTSSTLTINSTDLPVQNANAENGSKLIKIKLLTTDSNTYDVFTITILKDGVDAQSTIAAVLSNEVQMLPANEDGSLKGDLTGVSTQLTIYEQGVDKTSEWTINKEPSSGITLVSGQANYIATIDSITQSTLTGNVTFRCSKPGTDLPAFSKEFNVVKITAGADGETPTFYSIQAVALGTNNANDGKAVVIHEEYTYNETTGALTKTTRIPQKVRFYAYQQTGNSKTPYLGRIQFYVNGSNQISNIMNSDLSANAPYRDYDFKTNSGTAKLRAVLYESGANTKELDSQTVIVINDGSKGVQGQKGPAGVNAVSLVVKNEADVIPCDSNGHPFQAFPITIPFEGYQGTVLKATSASAPNLNSTTWGTSSNIVPTITNATTSAPGLITYTIPTTATVPLNGSIQLSFTVAAEGGNVSINNKLYSWTRSTAAENGENAVILTAVTPDGTVFENGEGILTIKGILYDGPAQASGVTYHYYTGATSGYNTEITTTYNSSNPAVLSIATQNGKKVLKVKGTAVNGYASYKIGVTYNNHTYEEYVSLIDKTDPLQVSVHSTIGTQIKNAQGIGCLYVRVTRDGNEIDPVPTNIVASETAPSGSNGDYYIKLTKPSQSNPTGSAQLMKHNGTTWVAQTSKCAYDWTYRNVNNIPLGDNDTKPAISGQFVYIDGSLIQNKITADVKVTLNESNS